MSQIYSVHVHVYTCTCTCIYMHAIVLTSVHINRIPLQEMGLTPPIPGTATSDDANSFDAYIRAS